MVAGDADQDFVSESERLRKQSLVTRMQNIEGSAKCDNLVSMPGARQNVFGLSNFEDKLSAGVDNCSNFLDISKG